MKLFTQKTIDVIQWILIVGLIVMLCLQGISLKKTQQHLVTSEEYNRENTYVRIYQSQTIDKLKKENRELYDSISGLQNVESAMIIQFQEKYKTDTITVDRFIIGEDSVYHYAQDNDTVNCEIDIKAKDLSWCSANVTINDKFVIVNREHEGVNQTSITHNGTSTVTGTSMWHREEKQKWYQRFSVGPQVGIGYGIASNKVDCYVGVGVSYKF